MSENRKFATDLYKAIEELGSPFDNPTVKDHLISGLECGVIGLNLDLSTRILGGRETDFAVQYITPELR